MKSIDAKDSSKHHLTSTLLPAITIGACLFLLANLIVGSQPLKPINVEERGGWLTHISTDKPIYRTGERLYVRGVVLRASSHTPGATGAATFEIKGPKGDIVSSGAAMIVDSIVGFSWDIPSSQPGGEYTVRISHPATGSAPAERRFEIRAYRAPRLKSQIVFVRDGYGPGDTVAANMHVDRAEGGSPSGARVLISARIDGEEVWKGESRVDALGNASASFKLPSTIERGEGTLSMIIEDGGIVETAAKTIPILLQAVDLSIYPEGGDLIAGLQNRVYIEGRTPAKKPADVAGIVVNSGGKEITKFRTAHDGRGRFTLVPVAGETYSLKLTEPARIKSSYELPRVKTTGVVLSSPFEVTPRLKDVVVQLASTTNGVYRLALSQHGTEFTSQTIALKAKQTADVSLPVAAAIDGVIVATVYDDQKTPLAERLLFREPEHHLNIHITADSADYVPGDKVKLRITTTDDTGKPVSGVVGLTVTDSSVLEMIDKREQTPRLPVMVLLENEVKDLADAHVYLDESNPKAPLAVDLLLGTQGWRRFALMDPAKFVASHGDSARRALALGIVADAQWSIVSPRGTLTGAVRDSSGALIPGATLVATSLATRNATTVRTMQDGRYAIENLPAGRYALEVSLPGFQSKNLPEIVVNSGVAYRYDFELPIAAMFELRALAAARGGRGGGGLAVNQLFPPAAVVRDLPVAVNDVLELEKPLGALKAELLPPGLVLQVQGQMANDRLDFRENVMRKEAANLLSVREYAHSLRPNWTEGSREDFAETVYWNAGVTTDATGTATVSFNLSDSVTSFRVLADGFTANGAVGSNSKEIESVQPFSIEPKMPLQVTSGDVIQIPIGLINGLNKELRGAQITAGKIAGLTLTLTGDNNDSLSPKERARRLLRVEVGPEFRGNADLVLDAIAGRYRDSVRKKIDVQPLGFPFETSTGGLLEANGSRSFEFTLPMEVVRGSLASSVVVYPTPLASMNEALQSLLQQPYGCFEQTSSTSYPMVMAQQYFLTHTGTDPRMVDKARELLDASYKRLIGFESHTKGYEWFGADPGHEALTAYGLMQFTDMSRVRSGGIL